MESNNDKKYEKVENSTNGTVNISGLGDCILKARNALKMSRIKAGAYCGVSEITFLRWEQGATKSIAVDRYNRLVDIMNGECA